MIKLYDASILDGLPDIIKNQKWAQCISKAVQIQMRKVIECANTARLYAFVDIQKHDVLDVMAIDLRVHEYKETLDINIKRSLIKEALNRWSKAGTKGAVEELCSKIFGDAGVLEWYEYQGRPYFFKVTCNNSQITEADVEHFKTAINSIKRLSAWLDNIELVLSTDTFKQELFFNLYDVSTHNFYLQGNTNRTLFFGVLLYNFEEKNFILGD